MAKALKFLQRLIGRVKPLPQVRPVLVDQLGQQRALSQARQNDAAETAVDLVVDEGEGVVRRIVEKCMKGLQVVVLFQKGQPGFLKLL